MNTLNVNALSRILIKFPKLFAGFLFCALGVTLMLTAGIGMNPWGTFTSGLVNVTGLSFGRLSQLIGFTIILGTLFMRIYPGIGTVLNMFFIGFFIDLIKSSGYITQPGSFPTQMIMCLTGLTVFSIGVYLYISCGLGAGPRDGLMLALIRITGKSVSIIKPAIEITVIVLGILLGGPIGIGTVLVALLGGKFLDVIFDAMKFDPKEKKQQNLVDLAQLLFNTSATQRKA